MKGLAIKILYTKYDRSALDVYNLGDNLKNDKSYSKVKATRSNTIKILYTYWAMKVSVQFNFAF